MQLDIFQHGRDVMLRNELAQALQRRDAQTAGSARHALTREYPQNPALTDASILIDALPYFDTAPFTEPVQVQQARERIDNDVAPAARRQFGDAAASRGSPAEQGWQLMMTLLSLERQGRHAELIEHRRRLKGLHEGLYRAYTKSR
jgi:hypothetical protein